MEKEALHRLLWKMAEFSGVRLVTDCIMGDPFHALVEVPRREIWLQSFSGVVGEERLFEHLRTLYSKEFVGLLRQELEELRRLGMDTLALARLEAIQKGFCDLSIYVKEVKERFSRWFKQTAWAQRRAAAHDGRLHRPEPRARRAGGRSEGVSLPAVFDRSGDPRTAPRCPW